MAKKFIKIIALVEILIGIVTLIGLTITALFFLPKKPLNIFIFVMISASISTALGVGILKYKEQARVLLIFFSGYIIFTKILIFSDLLQLCCDIVSFIPSYIKNGVSFAYHTFIILFFTQRNIKKYFIKNESRT